jgi:hypothetical protein
MISPSLLLPFLFKFLLTSLIPLNLWKALENPPLLVFWLVILIPLDGMCVCVFFFFCVCCCDKNTSLDDWLIVCWMVRWMFEKYDGVRGFWNPHHHTFFSRTGKPFLFPSHIISTMPHIMLDGELWYVCWLLFIHS